MPNLCAKCGENAPQGVWKIKQQSVRPNASNIMTMFVGATMMRRKIMTFTVPICPQCRTQMQRFTRLSLGLQILGAVVIIGAWLLYFNRYPANPLFWVGFVIGLAIFGI